MKKNITVQTDDERIRITNDTPDIYQLRTRQNESMFIVLELTDADMRELKYLIDEILQLANKQDY